MKGRPVRGGDIGMAAIRSVTGYTNLDEGPPAQDGDEPLLRVIVMSLRVPR